MRSKRREALPLRLATVELFLRGGKLSERKDCAVELAREDRFAGREKIEFISAGFKR